MARSSLAPPVPTETPPEAARPGFLKRHPILTYYALTFAISWGALVVLIAGWTGILPTAAQSASLLPVVFLITIAGPAIAGLTLTGLLDGRRGYRDFAARLRRWRVSGSWWAFALLTAPLVFTAAVVLVNAAFAVGLPPIISTQDKVPTVLTGVAVGLVVAACEETGWTGFAIPQFRLNHAVLATGLIVGVLWGLWHMPSQFWGSGDTSGELRLTFFLGETVFALALLPAYRLLMVWVYDHTHSLLLAIFMHAALVMSLFTLISGDVSDVLYLTWCVAIAVAMWLVVAAVGVLTHGHLTSEGAPTQAREFASGLAN